MPDLTNVGFARRHLWKVLGLGAAAVVAKTTAAKASLFSSIARAMRTGAVSRVQGLLNSKWATDWCAHIKLLNRRIFAVRTTSLFWWRGENTIGKRAKKMTRVVEIICDGLRTKTYDQFVAGFSNPGNEPDAWERDARRLHFHFQFSPTCWYEAVAEYPPDGTPHFHLEGGGDDWGVLISGDAIADHRKGIELLDPAGPDARAIVRALRVMPRWSTVSDFQRVGSPLPPQTHAPQTHSADDRIRLIRGR